MASLKQRVVNGALWSIVERFGYLGIQFIANLVLARLLTPFDFGTIGILLIFTTLAAVLVDSGLGSALIQKKDINAIDINSVFITNIVISVCIYLILFFSSNLIGEFFKNKDVPLLLRWIGVIVIIDSFGMIQYTLLMRELHFKSIAKLKIIAAFIACGVSIVGAIIGWGIWALIIQYILYSIIRLFLLYYFSEWRPNYSFNLGALKSLWSYGSKIMGASIISDLYINFQSILIGRVLSSVTLGYYTQAKQLQQIPVTSLNGVVNSVSFPAFSKIQDDKVKFTVAIKQNLKLLCLVNFPMMCIFSALAYPLIVFLYSDKWIPSVPYFQFLCLGFGLLLPIHHTNLMALKALGRSDMVFKLEIIKKISGILLLTSGIYVWGIWGLLAGLTINSVFEFFLNSSYLKHLIPLGWLVQFKLLFPIMLMAGFSMIVSFIIDRLLLYSMLPFIELIVGATIYIILYIGQMLIFERAFLSSLKGLFRNKV